MFFCQGLNWRHCAFKAHVMTTTARKHERNVPLNSHLNYKSRPEFHKSVKKRYELFGAGRFFSTLKATVTFFQQVIVKYIRRL